VKLFMKQKVFSFGDKFDIRDETGNSKYRVQGEVFSFGKKLHVYDAYNQEVAYVEQKLLSWMPKYELYIHGALRATIKKKITFFSHDFQIEGTDLRVDGDLFAHDFRLVNGQGQAVMALSKAFLSWGDSYQMEFYDSGLELLCIGINLCIDAAIHDGQNH